MPEASAENVSHAVNLTLAGLYAGGRGMVSGNTTEQLGVKGISCNAEGLNTNASGKAQIESCAGGALGEYCAKNSGRSAGEAVVPRLTELRSIGLDIRAFY